MFEKYTVQSNKEFMKNELIQDLADDNRWTVSDLKKRPVDAKYLLETYNVRNARVLDEPYPLVSLHDLNADENLTHTNRTYRLNAQNNNVIVIDVEPEASDEMLQFAVDFPAHQTEISTNGGVHLLIKLPDSVITPENEYLLTSTVIKSPNNDYEIIANDHYITFTKRLVYDKPVADYENNPEDFERLKTFLDNIIEIDAEAQRERELKRKMAIDFDDSDIHTDSVAKLIDSDLFIDFMERQSDKTPDDFGGDMSSYEASIATACAGHVYRFTQKLPYTIELKHTFEHMTENDWIYTAFKMAEFVIPFRDKHDEYRNGLPWLLYTAQNGWTFIRAMEEKDKERTN